MSTVRPGGGAARAAAVCILVLSVASPVRAQSAGSNPDISVIGQVIACPQGAEDCAYGEADGDLELQEVEFAFQGYLNPYVRGDVFAGYHAGEFEIEEAYASFVRGLGPFQARLGKYRVGWGNLNALHPHAYSWIFQPLIEERLFGEEGLAQVAGELNWSIPAGNGELLVSADLMRGDLAGEDHAHGDEGEEGETPGPGGLCVGPGCEDGVCSPGDADCAVVWYDPGAEEEVEEGPELAWHARVSWFQQWGEVHSFQVGVDGLDGTLDPALDRKVRWWGANAKYRWRPDSNRSLNLFASWMENRADLETDLETGTVCLGPDCVADVCPDGGVCTTITQTEHARGEELSTSGWYAIADWQFARRWNAGLKLDRAQGLEEDDVVRRTEAFVNFRLMEESTLFRFLVRREEGDLLEKADYTTALQLVFSLGPHRPHTF